MKLKNVRERMGRIPVNTNLTMFKKNITKNNIAVPTFIFFSEQTKFLKILYIMCLVQYISPRQLYNSQKY